MTYPPTLTVAQVTPLLGAKDTGTIYGAIADGTFPFVTFRIGRNIAIPTRPVLDALGLAGEIAIETSGDAA